MADWSTLDDLGQRTMTHQADQPNPVPGIVEAVRKYLQRGDYSPLHEPGTEPRDYLRELIRNPGIMAKNVDQAMNFAGLGVTKPITAIGAVLPETISSAATKIGGKIYTGGNHALAIDNARDALGLPWDKFRNLLNGAEDGFTTSSGRFVSREEANALAEQTSQIDKRSPFFTTGSLASESLKKP